MQRMLTQCLADLERRINPEHRALLVGGKQHQFAMGTYRFKPDGSALEFLHQFTNNAWGHSTNDAGDQFGGTANGAPIFYGGIPASLAPGGMRVMSAKKINEVDQCHTITPNFRQVDVFGGYTAHAVEVEVVGGEQAEVFERVIRELMGLVDDEDGARQRGMAQGPRDAPGLTWKPSAYSCWAASPGSAGGVAEKVLMLPEGERDGGAQ